MGRKGRKGVAYTTETPTGEGLVSEVPIGTALTKLELRRATRGLDDLAYATALGVILEVGDNNPFLEDALHDARRVVMRAVATQCKIPKNFLSINSGDSERFREQSVSFKLGYRVAEEILGIREASEDDD